MKFKIEHREELVGYFEVEADNEAEAMDAYQHLVQEAKIDYGDMEMVDSSDKLIRENFEVGQECFWAADKVHPEVGDDIQMASSLYHHQHEDGNIKSWMEFDAIRHNGTVIQKEVLSPDRIWRTGRTCPALVFTRGSDASIFMFGTEKVWPIKINATNNG